MNTPQDIKQRLALPSPDTLIMDPATVPEPRRHRIVRYDAPSWPVSFISDGPSVAERCWHWVTFPEPLREQFRLAAWTMLNHPVPEPHLRPDRMRNRGRPMRTRLSGLRTFYVGTYWRLFAHWLDGQGVTCLSEVSTDVLGGYCQYLSKQRRVARATAINQLNGLSRLYAYAPLLPSALRIAEPPWEKEGLDEYLPAAGAAGENEKEPITAATMGPLLIWALRFVEDFAPDILAAGAERQRLQNVVAGLTGDEGDERLYAYLHDLRSGGKPLPTYIGGKIPVGASATYIAAITYTPIRGVETVLKRLQWRRYRDQNPGPCPLDIPITGRIDNEPWIEIIDYHEADTLTRHLRTAAFVVIAYLTGMRPSEVLALEPGCCPDPEQSEETADARRHLIRARHFKTARDEHGNHVSAGVLRQAPWVAVPQVVTAIRAAEQLTDCALLFPSDSSTHDGRSMSFSGMNCRIESFIAWVNNHAATSDGAPAIPPDPHGKVGSARFRRTLAWHIARRPGGLVALAVQYGHLRTIVSQGYAARQRGGIHELLDLETARATAEHLSEIHDALEQGEGVSGPAAQRLIAAAHTEHHHFGGIVTTQRQAKALLQDPALAVFENHEAYLTCNYDPSRALCNPNHGSASGNRAPSLDRCRLSCPNIARTDNNARQLRFKAKQLRAQATATLTPDPIADRLTQRARQMDEIADIHDHTRNTLSDQDNA
ncbi:phage integrase family protein [Mycobacteroides abscessus subsp. bolletii]|uniref:integrase n=1 Tax=Mycobacteroides abscessus TaxID=36809 RepID=UPI000929782C|nr:integrase [Mycobacteroides abscessus]SIJ05582.1 phage integrase family protein [Mycobacteroides abscessus subsp. bolletii]SLD78285.1 phage integrase family protein [Mycobacteroides abscessus subsp. bolletii]SLD85693.1 phage integrase family protein [Mycobacteroides abscessus subsp. bolletii]